MTLSYLNIEDVETDMEMRIILIGCFLKQNKLRELFT